GGRAGVNGGVGGRDESGCCKLRDRDVIRMSVRAVGPEGHDNVGTELSQLRDNAADGLAWIGAIEMLVWIVEHGHFAKPQHCCGGPQLRLANRRQRRGSGMPRIPASLTAETAPLAPGRR